MKVIDLKQLSMATVRNCDVVIADWASQYGNDGYSDTKDSLHGVPVQLGTDFTKPILAMDYVRTPTPSAPRRRTPVTSATVRRQVPPLLRPVEVGGIERGAQVELDDVDADLLAAFARGIDRDVYLPLSDPVRARIAARRRSVRGFVQHVRVEIRTVGPHQRARFRVDADLAKKRWVLQCAKDATATGDPRAKVSDTVGPVGEPQGNTKRSNHLGLIDSWQHVLVQGRDLRWRLVSVQAPPVLEQLGLMERSPLNDKGQSPRRQGTVEKADRLDANLSFGPSVRRVEMGRIVIEEVHPDHDAKEARDLRHGPS